MTEEIQSKIQNAPTLLEKLKILLEEAQEPEIIYNKLPGSVEVVEDIALIQCFYGTDIARIRATTQALEFNLQMTRKPSTWVFVECQRKKSDCAFQWLKRYGVKHVFVQMKPENEGIMLKHPLWNIGVENCVESRLCFVDSDVVMCDSDWVEKAAAAFDSGMDVLSLASHQYCQADDTCRLFNTIGHKWNTEKKTSGGHVGFTLGLTRKTFNKLGGLQPAIILDDIHLFHRIVGDAKFKSFERWTKPFPLSPSESYGMNLEVGFADNIACHVWHGGTEAKYNEITKLLVAANLKSLSDIVDYSFKNVNMLPIWRPTAKTSATKVALDEYASYVKKYELVEEKPEFDIVEVFHSQMKSLMGEPDDKHPLFVCTVVKDGFGLGLDDFVKFKDRVEAKFAFAKVQPTILFFTDCEKVDFEANGLSAIPLKNYKPEDETSQYARRDVKFPKTAVIYHIPFDLKDFDADLWLPDEPIHNPDGTILYRNW